MNQYVRTSLGVAVIIIMASTIGFFSWTYYQNNLIDAPVTVQPPVKNAPKQVCTQEAKLCPDGVNYVGRTEANCEFAECPEIVGIADKLVIESPEPGETISSPISIIGRARGTWFFEGSFPVEVYDGNNKLIGSAPINFTPKSEQDTWMTTEFVDFKGEIKFTQPKTSEGYLLFKKDNPSDMRELDESFKLPVKFASAEMSAWKTYRNERLGFEMNIPREVSNYESKSVPIRITEKGNVVWLAAEGGMDFTDHIKQFNDSSTDLKRVNGVPWAILVEEVNNDQELDKFIRDRYGKDCGLGEKKTAAQNGMFDVEVKGENMDKIGNSDPAEGCFLNWILFIKYSPEKHLVAAWDMGQDNRFVSADKLNADGNVIDFDKTMADSFKFIK